MTGKQITQWVVVFSVLVSFSAYVLVHLTGYAEERAISRTIAGADALAAHRSFVVTSHDEAREQRREARLLRRARREHARFLRWFDRLSERRLVCAVTNEHLTELATRYETAVDSLEVDGQDVAVVKIQGEGVRRGPLSRDIRALTAADKNCRAVRTNRLLLCVV